MLNTLGAEKKIVPAPRVTLPTIVLQADDLEIEREARAAAARVAERTVAD